MKYTAQYSNKTVFQNIQASIETRELKQIQNTLDFYTRASPNLRKYLLYTLLAESTRPELSNVYCLIKPRLYVNIIENLPVEITTEIFKYLDIPSIGQASQVCRSWNAKANLQFFWHQLAHGYVFINGVECPQCNGAVVRDAKHKLYSAVAEINWKKIYATKYGTERNWRKGTFTTREFEGHSDTINCFQVNEKLNRMVIGSKDKTIRVWDIESKECIKVLKGHTDAVECIQFDEFKIVSESWDGIIKIWDFKTFECIKTLQSDMGEVNSINFLGNILAAGCRGGIKVWNLNDYSSFELRGHRDWVRCVQVVSSNLLLSSSDDKTVRLWNLNTRSAIQSIDASHEVYHFKLLLSPVKSNANELTSLPPGKLMTACQDRAIKIYDTKSGDLLKTLQGHSGFVRCVDADDYRIVSTSNDASLIIWDIESGEIMHKIKLKNYSKCCQLTNSGIWSSDEYTTVNHLNFKYIS